MSWWRPLETSLPQTEDEVTPGFDLTVGRVPHPSPANPKANRGWPRLATAALESQGVKLP